MVFRYGKSPGAYQVPGLCFFISVFSAGPARKVFIAPVALKWPDRAGPVARPRRSTVFVIMLEEKSPQAEPLNFSIMACIIF
jgi:hypothetical protein